MRNIQGKPITAPAFIFGEVPRKRKGDRAQGNGVHGTDYQNKSNIQTLLADKKTNHRLEQHFCKTYWIKDVLPEYIKNYWGRLQWLIPLLLATQEAEIRRITAGSQPWTNRLRPYLIKTHHKKKG
jgi:hypothetical protein